MVPLRLRYHKLKRGLRALQVAILEHSNLTGLVSMRCLCFAVLLDTAGSLRRTVPAERLSLSMRADVRASPTL